MVEEDAGQRQAALSEFSKMLGSVIWLCNLDPNRYKGHSFRIGAVTYAAEQGVPVFVSKYSGTCVIENKLQFDDKNDSYISKTMQSISVRSLLKCMLTPCLQISLVL